MYGKNKKFLVQLHLTPKCDQRCSHCYVTHKDTYQKELGSALDYVGFVKILDDITKTAAGLGKGVHFNLAGGDPLLWPPFFNFLEEAKQRGVSMSILGNPHHVDDDTASRLKEFNLRYYQVSLDGLQETHDFLRAEGSFKKTMESLQILKAHGIPCGVMFTLSRQNRKDLIPVARLCVEEKLNYFSFDTLVPLGNSKNQTNQVLSATEWKEVFEEYSDLKTSLGVEGKRLNRKGPLWTLYDLEKNGHPVHDKGIIAGCPAGISMVSILSDGSVLPCRRLPIVVGKMPEEKFMDIFKGPKLHDIRHIGKIKKCHSCKLFFRCRGCRALAYAVNGSVYADDPLCWKEKKSKKWFSK